MYINFLNIDVSNTANGAGAGAAAGLGSLGSCSAKDDGSCDAASKASRGDIQDKDKDRDRDNVKGGGDKSSTSTISSTLSSATSASTNRDIDIDIGIDIDIEKEKDRVNDSWKYEYGTREGLYHVRDVDRSDNGGGFVRIIFLDTRYAREAHYVPSLGSVQLPLTAMIAAAVRAFVDYID